MLARPPSSSWLTLSIAAGLLFAQDAAARPASTAPDAPSSSPSTTGVHAGQPDPGHAQSIPERAVLLKLITGAATSEQDTTPLFGVGGELEFAIVGHWLDIEVFTGVLAESTSFIVPVELLVRFALPIADDLVLFTAMGPTANTVFHPGVAVHLYPGGLVGAGFTLWGDHGMGLQIELDYAIIAESHPVHEIEAQMGIAWAF